MPIGLTYHGQHVSGAELSGLVDGASTTWIEGGVKRAIGVQAGNAAAGGAVEAGEGPPDHHTATAIDQDLSDRTVHRYARAGIEAHVQAAVALQAGNATAANAVEGIEIPSDHNATIRLEGNSVDHGIGRTDRGGGTCTGGEARVQGAIGVQACDVPHGDTVVGREPAANEDLAIGL